MITPNYLLSGEFKSFEPVFLDRFSRVFTVKKDSVIVNPEENRCNTLYYVLNGTAADTLHHESGAVKTIFMRGPGTVFPLYHSAPSSVDQSLWITAKTDMTLIAMPSTEFRQLLLEYPELSLQLHDVNSKYETALLHELANLAFETAETRVCNFLYIHHDALGDTVSMTHEEIGDITTVTRATVSRILSKLKSKDIIEMMRNKIIIKHPDQLINYCSCTAYHAKA